MRARALQTRQNGRRPRHALTLGLLTGGAYFGGTLYWIAAVVQTYGGLGVSVAWVLTGLLVAYLALFPALFALVMERLFVRIGRPAVLICPAVWVGTEFARATLFGGFPWVLLGYSQASVLPVAQLASLFGVYGVSGLVALSSAALVCLAVNDGRARWLPSVVAIAGVLTVVSWGNARLAAGRLTDSGTRIQVGLVQGNVPQEQKWDPARARAILTRYLTLTREAVATGAKLIVWPESSTPFFFEEDPRGGDEIRQLAREAGVHLLIGSDQIARGTPDRYYNAAFLVAPDGRTAATYRKIHLVPFGEYVPLRGLLFFAAPLVESVADFSAGEAVAALPVDGHLMSTAICFESVYPDLIRASVRQGSELLSTITNDAWYGYSSAPYQHFSQGALRAVEQGRYLVRAANTGISGVVDPYGRVVAQTSLFEPAVVVHTVRFVSAQTVYARIGDLFAHASAAVTLAALLVAWRSAGALAGATSGSAAGRR